MTTPAELDWHFKDTVGGLPGGPARANPGAPVRPGSSLDGATLLAIFDAQAESRHLDFTARSMQQRGRGFYTISSAGHEGNAAVAAALRPTDPALLHYRSGAFYVARAQQVPGADPLRDVLLGLVVAARRHRRDQLRRRLGQPLDRDRSHQHRLPGRLSGPADAGAVRLRGQRPGHQRPDARMLDRDGILQPAADAVLRRRRRRPGRLL